MVPSPSRADPATRHALAALALAALLTTAGCAGVPGIDLGPDCPLLHFVDDEPAPADATVESYDYADLSVNARTVFNRTLAGNGTYMTRDEALDSPEFRYGEAIAYYNVSYEGEVYRFRTRSGDGCSIDDE